MTESNLPLSSEGKFNKLKPQFYEMDNQPENKLQTVRSEENFVNNTFSDQPNRSSLNNRN